MQDGCVIPLGTKENFNGLGSLAIVLTNCSSSSFASVSKCNNGLRSRSVHKPGDGGDEGGTMEEESVSVRVVDALRLRRAVRSISESKRRSLSRDRRVFIN